MYRFLQLSFPARVAAIVITLVLVVLVYFAGVYFGQGYVTVSVDKPSAYVVIDGQRHDAPVTGRYRAGKKKITVGATGYVEQVKTITVPPFRIKKTYAFSLTQKPLYEEGVSGDSEANLIKQYPWIGQLPHREDDFEIEFPTSDGDFQVTLAPQLFVVPGIPDDQADAALRAAKKKALAWMKAQGADVTQFHFTWLPYDPDAP